MLEEFLDARHLARIRNRAMEVAAALATLRSRVGLEGFLQAGYLSDPQVVRQALQQATHPVTQALLLPFSPTAPLPETAPAIELVVVNRLRTVPPTKALHLALVEAVRRQYRASKQAADRRDKEAIRAASQSPPP